MTLIIMITILTVAMCAIEIYQDEEDQAITLFKNNNNLFIILMIITTIFFWFLFYKDKVDNPVIIKETEIIYEWIDRPIVIIKEAPTNEYEEIDNFSELMDAMPEENRLEWFIAYKEFTAELEDPPETLNDYWSEDELMYLYRCVESEVYGGDFDSKCNVASVIINRIESDRFPNTPKGVVTSPGQFYYSRKQVSEETILACQFAFEILDTTNGSLFFHSGQKTNTFNGAEYLFTDSVGHHFYR